MPSNTFETLLLKLRLERRRPQTAEFALKVLLENGESTRYFRSTGEMAIHGKCSTQEYEIMQEDFLNTE
jgi:hypothetical protein